MSTLDHYTPEQLRKGLSDLMYFLTNPRLDPVIWRVHEDATDGRLDHSKPREDSTSDLS
ncbi:MAG: hypothetical protein L7U42_03370 [Candidatus Nanopelagicales bacterium]|nr:hypothetical protein [Candidatus Nanopelagicales bacterium]